MRLKEVTPKAATKELIRLRPQRSEIDNFKNNLLRLLGKVDEIEREENQKNHVRDFLLDTFYKETNEINTKDSKDLVIHLGKSSKDKVGVIIEAKRPNNKLEMISLEKPNTKALHELVLYYMRERIDENNIDIKNVIATNIYEWFIIDAQYFEKFFARNKAFVKQYEEWRDGKKVTKDTSLFYNEIVKPYIESLQEEIPVTRFDIRKYERALKDKNKAEDKSLVALYKAQSPYHLLRANAADSNTLNEKFYRELLHIIGLEEATEGGKVIMHRKSKDRQDGSLLENTIVILETEDLYRVKNYSQYGASNEGRIFNVGLELVLTWVNRVLFLKLLEGQLAKYHRADPSYRFLNSEVIHDFDELYRLFHQVLARRQSERAANVKEKYQRVPYLNSSLFEISELEDQTIRVNALDNSATLELMSTSVLKDRVKKGETLDTLDYLFRFLDAYDFASEGVDEIQENNKSLINASVLGKVFEKINGYKDGSVYTPAFITMYMCRETIRRAVVKRFNEHYGWKCESLKDVYNRIDNRAEANAIINSLKICDPAVGSGHFLVSALNEIIAVKAELGVLQDSKGRRLKEYNVDVINDELIITDEYNDVFTYSPRNRESQRVQKTLFEEKQTIIENCLFGVDINSNSVKICRLRLWIELLKNAYYTEESSFTELETLPNIDINIKTGNSLISRFAINADLAPALKSIKWNIADYRGFVRQYKDASAKEEKRGIEELINSIKRDFRTEISKNDPKVKRLQRANATFYEKYQADKLFDQRLTAAQQKDKKKLEAEIAKLSGEIEAIKQNAIYQNALEWRFEFPEVLDDKGGFEGFDIVIGNPPYIQLQKMGEMADALQAQGYRTFVRTGDIYALFYELGIQLLKQGGQLGYITSNKWMRAAYGQSLREYFISDTNPLQLIDFANLQLFGSVTVNTNILISEKAPYQGEVQTCIVHTRVNSLEEMSDYFRQFAIKSNYVGQKGWTVLSTDEVNIKRKIEKLGIPLKEWDIQINYGIKTGYNNAFIISAKTKDELLAKSSKNAEIIRPILFGEDIKRYAVEWKHTFLINSHNGLKGSQIPRVDVPSEYPEIYSHLLAYRDKLMSRGDKGGHWTNLRNCAYLDDFKKPKIIYPEITKFLRFYYDADGTFLTNNKCFILTGECLEFLVCFFNSKLFRFAFMSSFPRLPGDTFELRKIFFSDIPVKRVSDIENERFRDLVWNYLRSAKDDTAFSSLESDANALVYQLYELSADEIALVEHSRAAQL